VQQMQRMQPNMAGHADPLQALSRPAAYGAESFADLGSDLNMPMPMQRPAGAPAPAAAARSPLAPVATAAPPARPPAPAVGMPAGAVFSWDAPAAPPRPAFSPSAPLPGLAGLDAPDALGAPAAPASPAAPLPARPAPVATPARAAAPAAPMPNAGTATEAALLAALIEGLGVPELRLERLTPGLMLLIGQVLRESTRGAVELLMARTELKREMRAELTMIVARENNPLKFSPSVDVALQHLLGPPATGFMPAAPAVRDAFDDLRAHQLGVMAGMKAALDGVLQRFDPAVLQGKLTRKSAIDSLLPSGRKARLWELFQELYGQISAEALDDFDELFGRAFLRAYEAQLDALAEQRTRR
ncbi:MAG: type secretion system-associated domain protein TagH, partial [Pseudomonadota bacterium]